MSNDKLKRAIQSISEAGRTNGLKVISGFVAEVYQEGHDNYGTIDFASADQSMYLKGVQLMPVEGSLRGDFSLPTDGSDVTIIILNEKESYVLGYSHIDNKVIDVNKSITLSATGVEVADDDTDYDEVAETGIKSHTTYQPGSIESSVVDRSGGNDISVTTTTTPTSKISVAEDTSSSDSTEISQSPTEVKIKAGSGEISHTKSSSSIKSQQITLSNGGATQKAVLGDTLATFLKSLVDTIAGITVATQPNPVAPINNLAAVQALRGQVDSILSAINNLE